MSLCHYCFLYGAIHLHSAPSSETLAEIERLIRLVPTRDIEVKLGRWEWSGDTPFPPWESLRKANIWEMADMQHIRDNLVTAIKEPSVTTNSDGVMSLSPGSIVDDTQAGEDNEGSMYLIDVTPQKNLQRSISSSIASLPFKGVIINIPADLAHSIHHFVIRLVAKGCPVILLGTVMDCKVVLGELSEGGQSGWSIATVLTFGKHWHSELHDQGLRQTVLIHPTIKIEKVSTIVCSVGAILFFVCSSLLHGVY
jgi:hypothetical protein